MKMRGTNFKSHVRKYYIWNLKLLFYFASTFCLCCKTMINTIQIKVVEMKYILLWYIIGKKKIRKESWESWENEKQRYWEEENFFLFLGMYITGHGKPFYRLSKWLPLISSLMNINETHK